MLLKLILSALAASALPTGDASQNINFNLNLNVNYDPAQRDDKLLVHEENKLKFGSGKKQHLSHPQIFNENPALFKLHHDIVTAESISKNEYSVSSYLQDYIVNQLGLQLYIDENDKRNIYAFGSESGNASVLLTSHIDTVPPFIGYEIKASEDDKEDVQIHGRGSCDAKGSVAAQIIAVKELIESGEVDPSDLALLFVHSEEIGGGGMLSANKFLQSENINWDTVIFGEPTENKLAVGHKGIYLAQIEVNGLASHSGYPEVGIDADKALVAIMNELYTYEWPSSEYLNKTTVNIGLIEGGPAANVVSPHAQCRIVLRTAVDIDQIHPIVESIIAKHAKDVLSINFELLSVADPVFLDNNVEGFEKYIASYATDIPGLDQRGFKRYLYGPGSILVAHGANEYVTAKSLLNAVEDYKELVKVSLK
ncbi:hypothetical protein DAMA08_050620 [Martiniozyma asiatica (nom. inval.)]|nr:hypothetical protein DAMA08_050620 [Martiniozyma asiatica]